jgi:hypothetical protein
MPYPSSYTADPNAQPVYAAVAAIDAAVGGAGVYVDAATLGTLPSGVYLVTYGVYFLNGAGAAFVNTKLLVGAVPYGPTEGSCIATGAISLAGSAIIEIPLGAGAIVKSQCTSTTATGSIKAAQTNGGANAGATWIAAVRIK